MSIEGVRGCSGQFERPELLHLKGRRQVVQCDFEGPGLYYPVCVQDWCDADEEAWTGDLVIAAQVSVVRVISQRSGRANRMVWVTKLVWMALAGFTMEAWGRGDRERGMMECGGRLRTRE